MATKAANKVSKDTEKPESGAPETSNDSPLIDQNDAPRITDFGLAGLSDEGITVWNLDDVTLPAANCRIANLVR